ncbi:hypothetical protein HanXRQr2_Chr04g0160951 [Helianthus annuus]|uniref:Retrovirus-related Pol polyprotein from transposon TNT 1-94-like beta-barrel domain-containing protein n=1 Tax=Helianthus annuus TaxID=4232 RepID=A0A251UZH2_HELAN|nr:hypothetical protein HanXRQr2_Chr04g0160951 [Helianthus annuus]KAJ0930905.1 hypothetical protein HanPSC8_Chr04g0155031 [Helianthus annuus]
MYASSPSELNTWFLDNGASNHMTGKKEWFTNLDHNIKGKVKFGDGSCVEIKGQGMGTRSQSKTVYFGCLSKTALC